MKFTSHNAIIYSSEAEYQHKLLIKELKELEAEFEKIMLIQAVAHSYTAKRGKN